jgi:uncharacterized membrane protein YphA (DoxX/SURF4 family)
MIGNLYDTKKKWSVIKKLSTLFALTYIFLYMFPFPADSIPLVKKIFEYYIKAFDSLNLWVGKSIFKITTLKKIENTGSGDTSFDYVKLFSLLLLSSTISLIIYAFTFHKKNYEKLFFWVMIYARYYLGFYMVIYGFAKIVNQGQFQFLGISQLEHTYGDSSPMGLLWTFMGYSKTYATFGGITEILAGILLFFRRTTTLGCLITIVLMTNVAMMNFCYDVPVKLFSCHLILIAIIIATPDLKRVFNFFINRKETVLTTSKLELPKRWMRITRIILKYLLILFTLGSIIVAEINMTDEISSNSKTFDGAYKTEKFSRGEVIAPSLTTDSSRWNKIIIEGGYAEITTMTDSTFYYPIKTDTVNKRLVFFPGDNMDSGYSFSYENRSNNYFFIKGVYKSDTISVLFKKKTIKDYLLVKRGFHWINEYPYNR